MKSNIDNQIFNLQQSELALQQSLTYWTTKMYQAEDNEESMEKVNRFARLVKEYREEIKEVNRLIIRRRKEIANS